MTGAGCDGDRLDRPRPLRCSRVRCYRRFPYLFSSAIVGGDFGRRHYRLYFQNGLSDARREFLNVEQRICKSHKVLVGLEVHVQLSTQSKMFTGAANGFGAEPNTQVDEQVLGLPGVLPVMNKRAVEYAIKVGLALGCTVAKHTKWDRKSYYYPDLPKNYQISQYDLPLCYQGEFELVRKDGSTLKIRIRRAHLEEDAGKLLHEAPGGYAIDFSIVDLNRAGTPLLEIVTEPDLSSPQDVALFGQELQKIVQFLGVSFGQMQMGHMRFEPNINVHITGSGRAGS